MVSTDRNYQSDDDFLAVRSLLVRSKSRTPLGFNWEVRRWDGLRWYRPSPDVDEWPVHLWWADGQCVGAVHDEGPGVAVLQVDPDHRYLEPAMLDWAQATFPSAWPSSLDMLVHALDQDEFRASALAERGYDKTGFGEVSRSMPIEPSPREVRLPDGYRLHELDASLTHDRQRLADLLNAAFQRDSHGEAEFRTFAEHAPSYRAELHLFAVAEDDTFAAHAATNLDAHNRVAIIEPVCTHPVHRRRRLARMLVGEAVRRAGYFGAETAEVYPSLDGELNRFYAGLGLTAVESGHYWRAPR